MENNDEYDPVAHKSPGPEEKDAVEDYEKREVKQITAPQEVLISKIMKSSKLKDSEYRMLKGILENQVVTSYDAAIFINYVLGILKFRRHFFNGKHKAYKKCFYCSDRNEVERYLDLATGNKAWVCETCAVNLDPSKVVPVKQSEENEVKCDLFRKERAEKLTPSQEDLVCEHREQ